MNAWDRNESWSYPLSGGIDLQSVMRQVYTWMVLGMLITACVAYVTASNPMLINLALDPIIVLIAVLVELGVVLVISRGLCRCPQAAATMLFIVYAALNGFHSLHSSAGFQYHVGFFGICLDRVVIWGHVRHWLHHQVEYIQAGYLLDDGGARVDHCDVN